jgi:transposase-like protein
MTPTLNTIERACIDLSLTGEDITITAVAQRVGIARSTIYRNQTYKKIIDKHRLRTPDEGITAITEEIATLRSSITTLATTVRRHETQIRHLNQKNNRLIKRKNNY